MPGENETPDNLSSPEQESAERLYHLRRGFEIACFALFCVLVFALVFHKVPYDLSLDIFLGSQIASGGLDAVRVVTPSSSALMTGWLSWLLSSGVAGLGGLFAAGVFSCLLTTAGLAVLLAAFRRSLHIAVAGLLLVAAVYVARPYFAPGGQAMGVFLLSVLAVLLSTSLKSRSRRFWLAIPVMIVWANSDLTWPVGFALCAAFIPVAAFAADGLKAEKLAALLLALAAPLLNPDFAAAYTVLTRVPAAPGDALAYLAPIASTASYGMPVLYAGAVIGLLLAIIGRSPAIAFPLASVLLFAGGVSVAAFPVTCLMVACGVVMPLSAALIRLVGTAAHETGFLSRWLLPALTSSPDAAGDSTPDWSLVRKRSAIVLIICDTGIVAFLALFYFTVASSRAYSPGVAPDEALLPASAVRFVSDNDLGGVVLTHPRWTGYVLTNLYPAVRTVLDSRPLAVDSESAPVFAWAFGLSANPSLAEVTKEFAKNDVAVAVVPRAWARAMDFKGLWTPVFWDDTAAVFLPNTTENAAFITAHDETMTYPPYFGFGLTPEKVPAVIDRLLTSIAERGDSAYMNYELGICYLRTGQTDASAARFILALGSDPTLAQAYHWLGDLVGSSPNPAVTGKIIGAFSQTPTLYRLYAAMRDVKEEDSRAALGILLYSEAARFDPDFAMAYVRLGNVLLKTGNFFAGIDALKKAAAADDRRPQLDRIAPDLRGQLDAQIKKLTTPVPRPKPADAAPSDAGIESPSAAPPDAPAAQGAPAPSAAPGQ